MFWKKKKPEPARAEVVDLSDGSLVKTDFALPATAPASSRVVTVDDVAALLKKFLPKSYKFSVHHSHYSSGNRFLTVKVEDDRLFGPKEIVLELSGKSFEEILTQLRGFFPELPA